jgi:SAM-dependent methyltransferase
MANPKLPMPEQLFDLSEQYQEMLRRGIDLSGESQEYFIRGRIQRLCQKLPAEWVPKRILDFGCGTGNASRHLAEVFKGASVVGVDLSEPAVAYARQKHGSARISFHHLGTLAELAKFDLCHVNGVFHHIEPANRPAALKMIYDALHTGGHVALFENNPWNPGTRIVMSRIPFDRDAILIPPAEARRLFRESGFQLSSTSFLFYFPRFLAALRFTESWLVHLPLGAQYGILGVKS